MTVYVCACVCVFVSGCVCTCKADRLCQYVRAMLTCSNKKETAYYFLIIVFLEKNKKHAETIACHHVALAKRAICLIGNTVRVEGR